MVTIGTPKSATATKVLLCGSGELGKEFVIELQRYGVLSSTYKCNFLGADNKQ